MVIFNLMKFICIIWSHRKHTSAAAATTTEIAATCTFQIKQMHWHLSYGPSHLKVFNLARTSTSTSTSTKLQWQQHNKNPNINQTTDCRRRMAMAMVIRRIEPESGPSISRNIILPFVLVGCFAPQCPFQWQPVAVPPKPPEAFGQLLPLACVGVCVSGRLSKG